MDFNTAVDRVLGHEGGYVNHPADPGGETNWGVTKAVAREHGYTGSMREMTRNEAKKSTEKPTGRRRVAMSCPLRWRFRYSTRR
ncbi:lysozyme family protein [Neisseria perflava]|nr:lysozyme family protein [Neisseria perflava]